MWLVSKYTAWDIWLKKNTDKINNDNIFEYIDKLYDRCYSGNDIVKYIDLYIIINFKLKYNSKEKKI